MKILKIHLIIWLLLVGFNTRSFAQDSTIFSTWKFAGVQYQVPAHWEGDPFGSYKPEEWNEHGSAVCECTGIIHIDYDNGFSSRGQVSAPVKSPVLILGCETMGQIVLADLADLADRFR